MFSHSTLSTFTFDSLLSFILLLLPQLSIHIILRRTSEAPTNIAREQQPSTDSILQRPLLDLRLLPRPRHPSYSSIPPAGRYFTSRLTRIATDLVKKQQLVCHLPFNFDPLARINLQPLVLAFFSSLSDRFVPVAFLRPSLALDGHLVPFLAVGTLPKCLSCRDCKCTAAVLSTAETAKDSKKQQKQQRGLGDKKRDLQHANLDSGP